MKVFVGDKNMKIFRDLKVGDTIYVGFEKKEVTEIKLDHPLMYDISICTNDRDWYVVPSYFPFDYNYSINVLIATDKEAIIKYYADQLTALQRDFETKNDHLVKMLKKAGNLK